MRKETKQAKAATINSISGYHGGIWTEDYAFAGFKANKYFTSDRFIPLDAVFTRPDGKPLKGFGLEIECECSGIGNATVLAEVLHKVIFSHFPADLFKLQRDGSLGGDSSAECITQVMTKEFIRNNYAAFKLMYDTYFPAFGISCGRNCGMHVNLSNALFGTNEKTQTEAVRKLYYIVNRHYDFCAALLHRDRSATGYCRRMSADKETVRRMDFADVDGGHGVCFNLDHWRTGRVELRLVGGQKNFPCFRNTMESVFFLIDAVKRISWNDCDDLTAIFSGCNQYVFDRIKSFCYNAGTITSAQVEAIRLTVKREDLL